MINEIDIDERIELDFGIRSNEVTQIFEDAISKADYLNHPIIIRCILFLADRNLEELKRHIEVATIDPRDVMYWAEYINRGTLDTPKRIRDFNMPFGLSELDVKE